MSGAAAARALEERFEGVLKTELVRLGRKMASLNPPERSMVESIAADVVRALASRPAQALSEDDDPRLVQALVHLFGMSQDSSDLSAR